MNSLLSLTFIKNDNKNFDITVYLLPYLYKEVMSFFIHLILKYIDSSVFYITFISIPNKYPTIFSMSDCLIYENGLIYIDCFLNID